MVVFECIYKKSMGCKRKWTYKPNKSDIIAHQFDAHQGNLSFLSNEQVFGFVKETDK